MGVAIGRSHLQLCGDVVIQLAGRRIEDALPSRQGVQLFIYLALNRHRPVSRDELIEALWPYGAPADADAALRTVLSRLRKAIGSDLIEGRAEVRLRLPPATSVDWEMAVAALGRAEEAMARSDWAEAWGPAQAAVGIAERGFLPGRDVPWIGERRRELEELRLAALECLAGAGRGLGDSERAATERAARTLIAAAPYREAGYLHLMDALAARGNLAEALRVYDELRVLLRDELGTAPGLEIQAFHERLLQAGAPGEGAGLHATTVHGPAPLALPHALAAPGQIPLIGRELDLGLLVEALDASRARGARLVLLTGEPGVGKTRLAAELGRTAHAGGTAVLYGRFREEALIPYEGLVEALRDYVAHAPLQELELRVDASGPELAAILPQVRRRLPHTPRPTGPRDASRRYRVFEAIGTLLEGISRSQPLLLILDDLHWADRQTTLMLEHVIRRSAGAPLMILGVAGKAELGLSAHLSGTLADLRTEGNAERHTLGGLDEAAVAALVEELAGCPATPPLVAALSTETEGNPFFVRELVSHLRETGAAEESDGRLRLRGTIADAGLPEAIDEVIRRRLSRLGEGTQRLLAVASVAGRRFDAEVLDRVAEMDAEAALSGIEEALGAEVLSEEPRAPGSYSFSHALIRQTLYAAISGARRAALHQRVGEALEDAYSPHHEPHLAELAHHFLRSPARGGALAKSLRYGAGAAGRATEVYAYEEAISLYERTIARLVRAGPEARAAAGVGQGAGAELEEGLGDAFGATGDYAGAASAYERALITEDHLRRARLYRKIGAALTLQRLHAEAEDALDAAEAALGRVAARERGPEWRSERIEARFARLTLGYWRGEVSEMDRLIEEERPRVEAEGTAEQRGRLLSSVLVRNLRRDRYIVDAETLAVARDLLAAQEGDGDPLARAHAMFNAGFTYLWAGEPKEAHALMRRALGLERRTGGDVALRSRCLVYLGIASRRLGNVAETRRLVEEALTVVREGDMVEYLGTCRANLAWLAMRAGDPAEARSQARAALEAWRGLPFVYAFQSAALWPLIEAALEDADLEEAATAAGELLGSELQPPPGEVVGLLHAALEACEGGDVDGTLTGLERALNLAADLAVA